MANKQIVLGAVFFVFSVVVGLTFISPTASFHGVDRNLASIPSSPSYDFSSLSGGSLKVAATKSVLSRSHLSDFSHELQIELASFNMSKTAGVTSNVCDHYGEVLVTFEATGVAVSGEKPEIELELPCLPGSKEGFLKKYSILKAQIVSIEVESENETRVFEEDLTLRVRNLDDFWPKNWRLKEISWVPQTETEETIIMSLGYNPNMPQRDFRFSLYK